jgi:hypothetical protein
MGAKKTKGFKYDSQNTCRLYGYLKFSFPVIGLDKSDECLQHSDNLISIYI